MSNINSGQLAELVNGLLYLGSDGNGRATRDHLLGAAAAANYVINAASGGVPVIGPPKKLLVKPVPDREEPSIVVGLAYSGGVVVIGPPKPKGIQELVVELISNGVIAVPRAFPDLSLWVEWQVPGALRVLCLSVVAAQLQAARAWASPELQGILAEGVERLNAAALG